jgi:hypothetical protein
VTTIAGSRIGLVDGDLKSAQFNWPKGIFFNSIAQSLLVCDYRNDKLRKILLCEGKIIINLNFKFVSSNQFFCPIVTGSVSTICDVPMPTSVAITEYGTILVTSVNGTISKLVKKGGC